MMIASADLRGQGEGGDDIGGVETELKPIEQGARSGPGWFRAWVVLMVAFAALVAPMVWLELTRPPVPPDTDKAAAMGYPSELLDQEWYHRGVIDRMVSEWPAVNVVSYDSATTPGYHFIQATILRMTGAWWTVQVSNALMGAAFVSVVYALVFRIVRSGWKAAALTAPVLASTYTIGGSIWMTTDNLCWMFVTLAFFGSALHRFTMARGARWSAYATAAVLVRQIHAWPAAVIGLAGLLRSPLALLAPKVLRDDSTQNPRRWMYLWAGVIAGAIPVVTMTAFLVAWQGLVPASDRVRIRHVDGPNFSAPAFALTCVAAAAVFVMPIVWAEVRRIRIGDRGLWLAGIGGAAAGLIPATSYLSPPRMGGWIWRIVDTFPAPMGRSIVIACGAPVGAMALAVMYRAAKRAGHGVPATMILLGALGWLCAQTVSTMAWQRYFDPMVQITTAVLIALGSGRDAPRWSWAGPAVFGVFQAGVTILTLHMDFVRKLAEAAGP